jgi:hypothetical protein
VGCWQDRASVWCYSEQRLALVEDSRGATDFPAAGAVADCGVDTEVWEIGGPTHTLDESEDLF